MVYSIADEAGLMVQVRSVRLHRKTIGNVQLARETVIFGDELVRKMAN